MNEIAIEQVKPNPDQPRKQFDEIALQELAESIQEIGLLNPILVRPNGKGYEVVHGERRLRASKMAGLSTIRAEVRELDDEAAFLIAFTENLQRDDLNAMEEAEALRALMDKFGYSQAETGRRIGKSQPWISGRLALLKLPQEIQEKVITRVIEPSKAREISRIVDKGLQRELVEKATKGNLTSRELEASISGKRKLSHLATLPSGPFRVIYANPPWGYSDAFRDVYPHQYAPMSIDELCNFGDAINPILGKDATLFVWVTPPVFHAAHNVIKAWGFEYKTNFVWVKDEADHQDDFTNNRHEFLFIGGRGKATPNASKVKLFKSVQRIKANGTNYEKPEKFREIIEVLYPNGRRIELFTQKQVDGWATWA